MGNNYTDFRDLAAYKKAFQQACEVFDITIVFPKNEQYSLTDQIRRSSRSVCANLAEAYRKRDYHRHFLLKSQIVLVKTAKLLSGSILL